jgi:prepilin-type N-terminal cleavage/methylation domain-containing protein
MARRGFTLIEALSVVSILGVLASLTVFAITQAQRQARDAKRKSDIATIAQGFEARYEDRYCTERVYPGRKMPINTQDNKYSWSELNSSVANNARLDSCEKPLSSYLPTLPTDENPYYFNLSTLDQKRNNPAKHYRLTAALEKQLSETEQLTCKSQSSVWEVEFGGSPYGCADSANNIEQYNYYYGR